mmetsp:Transcript_5630/g.20268  ORF Transcript_5630/g.20268 Transcript_5630/m.20268 type:complete len:528 (+) Transcript_5630:389-1972(+)
MSVVLNEPPDQLSWSKCYHLRGVHLLLNETGLLPDEQACALGNFLCVDNMGIAVQLHQEASISQGPSHDVDRAPIQRDFVLLGPNLDHLRIVLHTLNDHSVVDSLQECVPSRNLTLLQVADKISHPSLKHLVRLAHARSDDSKVPHWGIRLHLSLDPLVEPAGADLVVDKAGALEHIDEVVNSGPDLSTDLDVSQGHKHVLDGLCPGLTLGKQVPKLGVSVLVHTAAALDAEVSPHVRRGPEAELIDGPAGWLESVPCVLGRDPHGDNVAGGPALLLCSEVEVGVLLDGLLVEPPDVRDPPKRDSHADHHLAGRDVHPRNPLGDRVLHLQPRVQLQEAELVGVKEVEILHGGGPDVAHAPGEVAGSNLHLPQALLARHGDWPLLDDLLVPPLHAAVAAVHRADVAMDVSQQLDLEVAAPRCELHGKDGGPRDLGLDLLEDVGDVLAVQNLSDSLSATAPRGFEHDRVADLVADLRGLVPIADAGLPVHILGDHAIALLIRHSDVTATPPEGGNLGGLREDRGANLVA